MNPNDLSHWELIAVTIISAIPPTLAALAALMQGRRTHLIVNSRMTELLRLARDESAREARTKAEAFQRALSDSKAVTKEKLAGENRTPK